MRIGGTTVISRRLAAALMALGLAAHAAAEDSKPSAPELGYSGFQSARARIAARLEALEPADGVRTASYSKGQPTRRGGETPPAPRPPAAATSSTAVLADGEEPEASARVERVPALPQASICDHKPCIEAGCKPVCCPTQMRNWVTVDYLYWWVQGSQTPPLITTSPDGTPLNQAGILGQPGTAILFGNTRVDDDGRSGGRLRFGRWLDDCGSVGFSGEFFGLENASSNYVINSDGSPILARPFFDASTNMQNRQIDAYPGVIQGGKVVDTRSSLIGAGASGLCNLSRCCWCCNDVDCDGCGHSYGMSRRVDFVMGYRFLRLDDDFSFNESAVITNPNALMIPVAAGTRLDVNDTFETENIFNGGELGLQWQRRSGRWSLDVLTKVALGNTRQKLYINGQTLVNVPGVSPATVEGGFLALPTNIGSYTRDQFSVIPEFDINLGFALNEHLRVRFGYTFIYWTNVLRATEQIDTVINPTQFPLAGGLVGPARPAPLLNDSDIWIQGLNAGLEFTW